jgi:hypothetical protein
MPWNQGNAVPVMALVRLGLLNGRRSSFVCVNSCISNLP